MKRKKDPRTLVDRLLDWSDGPDTHLLTDEAAHELQKLQARLAEAERDRNNWARLYANEGHAKKVLLEELSIRDARLAEAERRLNKALEIMTPAQIFHYDKPHKEARPDYSGHPQYEAKAFRPADSADVVIEEYFCPNCANAGCTDCHSCNSPGCPICTASTVTESPK